MSDATLKLAYYADDFTGATDALEVLANAGLDALLFLEVPTAAVLKRYPGLAAIGIAGASRTMTPKQMDQALPAAFAWLHASGAPVVHYKVCSTFDSAPHVGSIGRVLALARPRFGDTVMPIVAATPHLARYCVWGHLFARSGTDGRVHRIDRHPIMSVHPVTPMRESDLRAHLGAQGAPPLGHGSLAEVAAGAQALVAHLRAQHAEGQAGVVIDGQDGDDMQAAGDALLALGTSAQPVFVVGGSGVEDALVRAWGRHGARALPAAKAVAQVLAVSGSASALSALQIDAAVAAGFAQVALDGVALTGADGDRALHRTARALAAELGAGRSVVAHTARGPGDARLAAADDAAPCAALAACVGRLVRETLKRAQVPRVVISGGDTASAVARALDVQAVRACARLAAGAPLCRVLESRLVQGQEIAFKGGQMGGHDFFVRARDGA